MGFLRQSGMPSPMSAFQRFRFKADWRLTAHERPVCYRQNQPVGKAPHLGRSAKARLIPKPAARLTDGTDGQATLSRFCKAAHLYLEALS